jgi:hypothetical protein
MHIYFLFIFGIIFGAGAPCGLWLSVLCASVDALQLATRKFVICNRLALLPSLLWFCDNGLRLEDGSQCGTAAQLAHPHG